MPEEQKEKIMKYAEARKELRKALAHFRLSAMTDLSLAVNTYTYRNMLRLELDKAHELEILLCQ